MGSVASGGRDGGIVTAPEWGPVVGGAILAGCAAALGWVGANVLHSRAKNRLRPDPNAEGDHTTFKRDPKSW